ncbi:hypothetical protein GCM10009665_05900 [Kitasatospora nipponensis]|uniref:DUF4180 domain-containing protein n=1 Tax=Kitasatospora nipponensis TaxID=258049 RepID=A0ABN1VPD0_9ACTN
MPDLLQHPHGIPVLQCDPDGPPLRTEADALDVVGSALHHGAHWVAVPAERFDDGFFQLRSRLAGEILQKFANYRLGLAVIGDISRHLATGTALPDLIRESNRGHQAWFLPDAQALHDRLAPPPPGR